MNISIITALKNRSENLLKAIDSWLKIKLVTEIIIVDWDSEHSLYSELIKIKDDRIKLYQVKDQPKWCLAQAFNLAALVAKENILLKLDADIIINSDFNIKHPLEQGTFYTGNWRNAKNPNEIPLNGVLYMFKADFELINGYNEYYKLYGWDDSDLHKRLEDKGLKKLDICNESFYHIPHENRVTYQSFGFKNVSEKKLSTLGIIINRRLTNHLPPWSLDNKRLEYEITKKNNQYSIVESVGKDENIITDVFLARLKREAIQEELYKLGHKSSMKTLSFDELSTLYIHYNKKYIDKHTGRYRIVYVLDNKNISVLELMGTLSYNYQLELIKGSHVYLKEANIEHENYLNRSGIYYSLLTKDLTTKELFNQLKVTYTGEIIILMNGLTTINSELNTLNKLDFDKCFIFLTNHIYNEVNGKYSLPEKSGKPDFFNIDTLIYSTETEYDFSIDNLGTEDNFLPEILYDLYKIKKYKLLNPALDLLFSKPPSSSNSDKSILFTLKWTSIKDKFGLSKFIFKQDNDAYITIHSFVDIYNASVYKLFNKFINLKYNIWVKVEEDQETEITQQLFEYLNNNITFLKKNPNFDEQEVIDVDYEYYEDLIPCYYGEKMKVNIPALEKPGLLLEEEPKYTVVYYIDDPTVVITDLIHENLKYNYSNVEFILLVNRNISLVENFDSKTIKIYTGDFNNVIDGIKSLSDWKLGNTSEFIILLNNNEFLNESSIEELNAHINIAKKCDVISFNKKVYFPDGSDQLIWPPIDLIDYLKNSQSKGLVTFSNYAIRKKLFFQVLDSNETNKEGLFLYSLHRDNYIHKIDKCLVTIYLSTAINNSNTKITGIKIAENDYNKFLIDLPKELESRVTTFKSEQNSKVDEIDNLKYRLKLKSDSNRSTLKNVDNIVICLASGNISIYGASFFDYYINQLEVDQFIFVVKTESYIELKTIIEKNQRLRGKITVFETHIDLVENKNYILTDIVNKWIDKFTWVIVTEIDQFLDYPSSNFISFKSFLKYFSDNKIYSIGHDLYERYPATIDEKLLLKHDTYSSLNKDYPCIQNKPNKFFLEQAQEIPEDICCFYLDEDKQINFNSQKSVTRTKVIFYKFSYLRYHYCFTTNEQFRFMNTTNIEKKYYENFSWNSYLFLRETNLTNKNYDKVDFLASSDISFINFNIESVKKQKLDDLSNFELIKLIYLLQNRITTEVFSYSAPPIKQLNEAPTSSKETLLTREKELYGLKKQFSEFQQKLKVQTSIQEKKEKNLEKKLIVLNEENQRKDELVNTIYKSVSWKIGNKIIQNIIMLFGWLPFIKKRLPSNKKS